jgi:hypothetical protein
MSEQIQSFEPSSGICLPGPPPSSMISRRHFQRAFGDDKSVCDGMFNCFRRVSSRTSHLIALTREVLDSKKDSETTMAVDKH